MLLCLIIFPRRRQVEWVAGEAEEDDGAADIDYLSGDK